MYIWSSLSHFFCLLFQGIKLVLSWLQIMVLQLINLWIQINQILPSPQNFFLCYFVFFFRYICHPRSYTGVHKTEPKSSPSGIQARQPKILLILYAQAFCPMQLFTFPDRWHSVPFNPDWEGPLMANPKSLYLNVEMSCGGCSGGIYSSIFISRV